MTEFSRQHIDDIINATDLVGLIAESHPLSPAGNEHTGLCPFHDERTPSFTVTPAKGLYYCFACGASGDAITYVRHQYSMSFSDALQFLAGRVGYELPTRISPRRSTPNPALESLTHACSHYHEHLLQHSEVLSTLDEHGISRSIIERYRIGLIDDRKHFGPGTADAGLIVPIKNGTTVWAPSGHLCLPLTGARGQIYALSARDLSRPGARARVVRPAPSQSRSSVAHFGYCVAHAAKPENTRLLVERDFDVLALAGVDIDCALSLQANPLDHHQIQQLFTHAENLVYVISAQHARTPDFDALIDMVIASLTDTHDIAFVFLPSRYRTLAAFLKEQGAEALCTLVDNAHPIEQVCYRRSLSQSSNPRMALNQASIRLAPLPSWIRRRLCCQAMEQLADA